MYRETISLEEALQLEKDNQIIIFNPNRLDIPEFKQKRWIENWDNLRKKYKKVPVWKLKEFANLTYSIELKSTLNQEPPSTVWSHIYGQDVEEGIKLLQSQTKGQYVYILTNISQPDIVKIGKAVNPQKRIKQINNAGVVVEWELKWALPVSNDYLVERLVHEDLSGLRVGSHQGSAREFFTISYEEAKEKILYLAKDFIVGEPTEY